MPTITEDDRVASFDLTSVNNLNHQGPEPSMSSTDRDRRVFQLYEQLLEIEQCLIPTGLHVFGRASELQEKADLLRMVASFDRPEQGARALPKLIAEALGIGGYDGLIHDPSPNDARDLIGSILSEA